MEKNRKHIASLILIAILIASLLPIESFALADFEPEIYISVEEMDELEVSDEKSVEEEEEVNTQVGLGSLADVEETDTQPESEPVTEKEAEEKETETEPDLTVIEEKQEEQDEIESESQKDEEQANVQYITDLRESMSENRLFSAAASVAEVDGVGYSAMNEALAAWASGTTLKLYSNLSSTVTVPVGTKTLDLNGHNISKSGVAVKADGTNLTIIDSSGTPGKISNTSSGSGSAIDIKNGSLNLSDVTVESRFNGIGLDNCTANIYSGQIRVTSQWKTCINVSNNSKLTIYGGTLWSANHMAIYMVSSEAEIEGGSFKGGISAGVTIRGGYFDRDVSSLCAPDAICSASDDTAKGAYMVETKILHNHNDIEFTEWGQSNSLPNTAGNYYLTNDVEISSTWTVPQGTVNLCLNGYTIKGSGVENVIRVDEGCTLTVCDCKTTGTITGGQSYNGYRYGAGVYVVNGHFILKSGTISGNKLATGATGGGGVETEGADAIFDMYGGTICNNEAGYGGGVYVRNGTFNLYDGVISNNKAVSTDGGGVSVYSSLSTFNMYGGSIIGNTATSGGGIGVSGGGTVNISGGTVSDNTSTQVGGGMTNRRTNASGDMNATISISGAPVISGNTGAGSISNVYLFNGIVLNIGGVLKSDAVIGVSMSSKGVFTSGLSGNGTAECFTCDNSEYTVRLNGSGEAEIGESLFSGKGTEEQPYLIQSEDDWNALSEHINSGGTQYSGCYFKLTENISISTVLGNRPNPNNDSNDNVFCGTFDGDGHTLEANISESNFAAPFGVAHNATIKNLRVTGSVTSTANHASGLVAASKASSLTAASSLTIQNVTVSADISCNSHVAGIVGHAHRADIVMENVVFDGSLSASSVQGGFIGWGGITGGTKYNASFKDCIFSGTYRGGAAFCPVAFASGQGTATLLNDFYTTSLGSGGSPIATGGSGQVKLVAATVEKEGTVRYFDNIATALDGTNWTDGSTLKLLKDVTIGTTLTVPSGNHNLDLNGHGIIRTNASGTTGSVISVGSGSTLNLYDGANETEHRFTVSGSQSNGAGLATVNDGLSSGYKTFTGGYITGGNWTLAGGVYVDEGGTFNMYGGNIIGNQTTVHGGGVGVAGPGGKTAVFNMYGGSICYNSSFWGGGVNIFANAYINENCSIHHNTANNGGGGIEIESGGKLYMNGGSVTDNIVLSQNGGMWKGGGVHLPNGAECHFRGKVQIKNNYQETAESKQNNLFVRKEVPGKAVIDAALTEGALIGVGTNGNSPFTITSGYGKYHGASDLESYFTSDNEEYKIRLSADGEVCLLKGIPGVEATDYEGDYDGNAHSITVSAPDGVTVKYGEAEGSYTASDNPSYTNAGAYTVYYEVSKDGYDPVSGSATVTINPIGATVTITGRSNMAEYDGNEHSVSGYDAVADSALYDAVNNIQFSGNAAASQTNVGTANMGLTADQFENISSNFNNVVFVVTDGYQTVTPADAIVTTAPKTKGILPYSGAEQEIINEGVVTGGTLYYAVGDDESSPDDAEYSTEIPKAADIGYYYIWYKIKGDENHNDSTPLCIKTTVAAEDWVTISGVVCDSTNTPTGNASVRLMQGNKVVDKVRSDAEGGYSFAVPAGLYNVVIKTDDSTVTSMVDLSEDTTKDIDISSASTESLLDVVDSDKSIVVGKLNDEAYSIRADGNIPDEKNVSVKLTVKSISENDTEGAKKIMEDKADRNLEFYDLKVEKNVDSEVTQISETQNVLEFAVPCPYSNKRELAVYDYCDSEIHELTESTDKTAGTFYVDKEKKIMYIYLNRFSTIAMGYKPYYRVNSSISLGNFNGTASVTLIKDGTGEKYEPNNVSGDNISFKDIPKGNYTMNIVWKDGAQNTLTLPFTIK